MARIDTTKATPGWWTEKHTSNWDHVKAAFERDWEQTKADFSKSSGEEEAEPEHARSTRERIPRLGAECLPLGVKTHPTDPKLAVKNEEKAREDGKGVGEGRGDRVKKGSRRHHQGALQARREGRQRPEGPGARDGEGQRQSRRRATRRQRESPRSTGRSTPPMPSVTTPPRSGETPRTSPVRLLRAKSVSRRFRVERDPGGQAPRGMGGAQHRHLLGRLKDGDSPRLGLRRQDGLIGARRSPGSRVVSVQGRRARPRRARHARSAAGTNRRRPE